MRKLRTGAIVLLTVLLIAALSILPRAVAAVSDFLGDESVRTAPMQSVEISFDTDQANKPGYMLRKLALESRMTTIPIRPEQASMTEEEVYAAAMAGMNIYIDANLFDWFDINYQMAQPYLGIDPNDKNNNTIFWGVTFSTKNDPYHYLFLHIDDETGKILYLTYETYGEDRYRYYPENQHLMMEGFDHAYLQPLNLLDLSEYENLVGEDVNEMSSTDEVTTVRRSFYDAVYGEIHVEFNIYPNGFFLYFQE